MRQPRANLRRADPARRQQNTEAVTPARRSLVLDLAAVGLHGASGDRETQAQAVWLAPPAAAGAMEAVENPVALVQRNGRAVVFDFSDRPPVRGSRDA